MPSAIYKISNTITNDIYIGSSKSFSNRRTQHIWAAASGKHHSIIFQRAWDKYGQSNFKFEIVERCKIEDLAVREQYYLDLLKPKYNIARIAYKCNPPPNKPIIRTCMSTGVKKEFSTRDEAVVGGFNEGSIASCCWGRQGHHKGYYWKFKDGSTPDFIDMTVPKRVIRIDDKGNEKTYESLGDAETDGFISSAMSAVCLGKLYTYKGYRWKYEGDITKPLNTRDKIIYNRKILRIAENGDIVSYPSLSEVSNDGFNCGNVRMCCVGKRGTHKGYKWQFADNPMKFMQRDRHVVGMNIYTGKFITYERPSDSKKDGFRSGWVAACCNGRRKTHKEYYWKFKGANMSNEELFKDCKIIIKKAKVDTVVKSAPTVSIPNSKYCPFCGKNIKRVMKHISSAHPSESNEQEELVLKYYNDGLSARKIVKMNDVLYSGATSVVRILKKYFSAAELESGRRSRIGSTTLKSYAAGERDWVKEINSKRSSTLEARIKNSVGGKRAYAEGRHVSWNAGHTKFDDPRIRAAGLKCSATAKLRKCTLAHRELMSAFGGTQVDNCIVINDIKVHIASLAISEVDKNKINNLKEAGALVFFNDEWVDKKEIITSMINHKVLGKSKRIFARKCSVVSVSRSASKEFFNSNHLSGSVSSSKSFGLEYKGELFAVISMRKPFIRKYSGYIEIARFATKLDHVIVGGLSKLLKYVSSWASDSGFSGILTYADLKIGEGSAYSRSGFTYIGKTSLDYFYTDGKERFNRFKFRACGGMTEREYASSMGVHRIYGCGSNIFKIEF